MRNGKLVGIVSRDNLVQALAAAGEAVIGPVDTTDETIRARLQETLGKEPWWSAMTSTITVSEGIVHFWGLSARPDEHDASKVAAETITGVRGVTDHRMQPDGRLADV